MPKPKIIVCATAYHPFVGGAEIAIQEVAGRLAGRLDFYVLTARMSRALPHREVRPEATVIRLGLGARFDKWLLPFLIPWHLRSKFFTPHQKFWWGARVPSSKFLLWGMDISQGSLGGVAAKIFFPRVPFVLTVQYGESEEYLRHGRGGLIARGFRLMLARADRVTAISSYLLALVHDFDYCGPARVIHNGVDIKNFNLENSSEARPRRKRRGIGAGFFGKESLQRTQSIISPPSPQPQGAGFSAANSDRNSKVVITVSRLVVKNRIDVLIGAFGRLKEIMRSRFGQGANPIQLQIIGDGPEMDALKRLSIDRGVSNETSFLGTIPNEAIPRYLAGADVFIRPSDSEGMGTSFVEAMAAGVPVVGTSVGGIPDVIEDGKTGLLAERGNEEDIAEKIARLLNDRPFAKELVSAGKEKAVRQFDWDAIARVYGEAFREEIEAKKRIVIATGLFPPEIGGPATYTKLLVDALLQRGIGLRVVPFRSVRALPKVLRHIAYFFKIAAASRGSDIVFAQDPVSTGLPALCAARLMRKKFLLKVVGDYAWEQYRNQESGIRSQGETTLEKFQMKKFDCITEVRRAVQRSVARRAARIIVPSEYLKGVVARWGVAREKITVIYNAFAPPGTLLSKMDARAALGIAPDTFFIVSAGRLVPWKGFGELIGVLAVIQREISKARLVIVGSGPDENALRKNIADGKMGDIVSLAGGISHEETLRYLRAADLFVLNSSYEGFSHTILEALAIETPVMASDAGGNKEIITDGVNGRLYPRRDTASLAEEIMRLYRDPQARERFTQEGKVLLERFSRDAMVSRTAAVLISL